MVDRNEYKRRQGPIGVKITPRAFGRDWRLPIVNRFRNNSEGGFDAPFDGRRAPGGALLPASPRIRLRRQSRRSNADHRLAQLPPVGVGGVERPVPCAL